ncbi:MAG TPA: RNA polymerase sigma factor [Kofleriaceae bacterium]|nr:RNA polymerase sigma factor [Kofleriaceae bacterium]
MDDRARRSANELLAALADGDRAAFAPLYALLWPVVVGFCRRVLGSESDADDAAQEAMVRLFQRASQFDPARDATTWALTFAVWECRTVRRRRARRREVALPPDGPGSREPDDLAARELEAAAVELLGELRPGDASVIAAAMSGESADRAGVAPATYRKRLERALGRLRLAWRSRHGAL